MTFIGPRLHGLCVRALMHEVLDWLADCLVRGLAQVADGVRDASSDADGAEYL